MALTGDDFVGRLVPDEGLWRYVELQIIGVSLTLDIVYAGVPAASETTLLCPVSPPSAQARSACYDCSVKYELQHGSCKR